MSEESQDQSEHSGSSINSDDLLEDLIWEEINDPLEAKIEAKIEARLLAQPRIHSRRYVHRDREGANDRLVTYYFCENPLYTEYQFRRRYRMRKHLFLKIVEALSNWSPYFRQRRNAFGKKGFSPLQKCTAAIRMLAYGSPADVMDETLQMSESTAQQCLIKFVKGVREIFGQQYLRRPTNEDIERLLHIGEARGFPRMLGSLDCMHWHWQNCPVAWKGQYTRGDKKVPTIMLEAVASADRWIWHAFFGAAGSNNDINVLNQSPLFTHVLQGRAPEVKFTVNGTEYNMGYYLGDGIYPEWATFVKSISMPQSMKHKLFVQKQESARKDVECAFGILQKRWAIIREPARLWEQEDLADIMYACIILHNMIVEDERDNYQLRLDETYDEGRSSTPIVGLGNGPIHGFSRVLEINAHIHNSALHHQLKADLIEHIWNRFGHETLV